MCDLGTGGFRRPDVKKADRPDYGVVAVLPMRRDQKALMPVSSRPIVSWWIVSVPS
jgi:hypothetical protein